LTATFPGASPLEIECWDYDDLFGDDLIGKTVIDLDDRFFCPEWKSIIHKPVEFRELYHPSTAIAQGTVKCWLEIFEQEVAENEENKLMDITPEQSMEYQLRVSIYDTKNVPMVDIEGMSDVFIKAWIDEKNQKETDTHWRCSTGEASFNWRMLFNINCPNTSGKNELDAYKLKFAVYDRDILSGNDFICDYEIDLRLMMEDCKLT